MALTYSKKLTLVLNKSNSINLFAALRTNFQNVLPVAHYSDNNEPSKVGISRAMKKYLETVVKYDSFLKEQLQEYNRGKEFLAGMMGRKSKEMTQEEVDEAINYLFPSALYVPKSRPMMKPPDQIFEKKKEAMFDYTGRPFHFLFYTNRQNFCQYLHDAASKIEELNLLLYKSKKIPPKPLALIGGRWINCSELREKLGEKIYESEYDKFIEVFKKLSAHPFAVLAENLIKQFWIYEKSNFDLVIPEISTTEDGKESVTVSKARKKWANAEVKLTRPGSGRICINNSGLDYFFDIQGRVQSTVEITSEFKNLGEWVRHKEHRKRSHQDTDQQIRDGLTINQKHI